MLFVLVVTEEEIDVVTIGEKQSLNPSRCSTALPTNPTVRDRQKLQRTVACAISNKREYGPPAGQRRLPLRNSNTPPNERDRDRDRSAPGARKRGGGGENTVGRGGRGIKRARHHR